MISLNSGAPRDAYFWSYRQLVLALAALTTLTVSEQWASVDRAETSF
jgi:hypothetical protein